MVLLAEIGHDKASGTSLHKQYIQVLFEASQCAAHSPRPCRPQSPGCHEQRKYPRHGRV